MVSAELRAKAEAIAWHHSIELGDGIVTSGRPGAYISETALPDLKGRSVLDIGAWDGYYSFLAERLGASRVVALDHYVWGVDIPARERYWAECRAKGMLPDHTKDTTEFWRPDLPGRRGFDLAKEALGSAVEPVVADFMTADVPSVGVFDVVFYFGVLYHMKEPLTSLERVRAVTRSVAVVESEAIHMPQFPDTSLLQFIAGDDLAADFGNWYVPTAEGLRHLCRAAGFSRVDIVVGPPDTLSPLASVSNAPTIQHYRIVARAYV